MKSLVSGPARAAMLMLAGASLSSLSAVSPATAADIAARPFTKAPPVAYVAPPPNWTGLYVGIEGGGGWGREGWHEPVSGTSRALNKDGGLVGGVIGFNYQVGQTVFGVEGSYDWADLKRSELAALGGRYGSDSNWLASVTGRVGYTWGSSLLYVKGGGAWTRSDIWLDNAAGGRVASAKADRSGWTVGVGLEYLFAPNFSAKVEYDYYDFGSRATTFSTPAGTALGQVNTKLDVHSVKAGVNYHFNWGGPAAPAN